MDAMKQAIKNRRMKNMPAMEEEGMDEGEAMGLMGKENGEDAAQDMQAQMKANPDLAPSLPGDVEDAQGEAMGEIQGEAQSALPEAMAAVEGLSDEERMMLIEELLKNETAGRNSIGGKAADKMMAFKNKG